MSATDPEAAQGDAPFAGPESVGTAGLISTIRHDLVGWVVLALAVGLAAGLRAIPIRIHIFERPSLTDLTLESNLWFQWSFSVPVMAYLVLRGRLGWLAALYGIIVIGAAHYVAATLTLNLDQSLRAVGGFVGGFTGAAISLLAFLAFGRTLRTRRALACMAAGAGALTALGGLLAVAQGKMLYVPWQLVFGALILLLTRSWRATLLW